MRWCARTRSPMWRNHSGGCQENSPTKEDVIWRSLRPREPRELGMDVAPLGTTGTSRAIFQKKEETNRELRGIRGKAQRRQLGAAASFINAVLLSAAKHL